MRKRGATMAPKWTSDEWERLNLRTLRPLVRAGVPFNAGQQVEREDTGERKAAVRSYPIHKVGCSLKTTVAHQGPDRVGLLGGEAAASVYRHVRERILEKVVLRRFDASNEVPHGIQNGDFRPIVDVTL